MSKCHQVHKVVASDCMSLDIWDVAQRSKVLHKVITSLRTMIVFADDEAPPAQVAPLNLIRCCELVARGHDHKDTLAPEVDIVASLRAWSAGQKGDVKLEPLNPRDVGESPTLDDIRPDAGIALSMNTQQVR